MSKDQKGFVVYGDIEESLNELTDEQVAKLFRGMVSYFNTGKEPKFSGLMKMVFIPIRQQMDRDTDKYEKKWYGDEKMRPYLRPSTLFGDKFGEYLAAPISVTAERERDTKKKRSELNKELDEKRQALSVLKESLSGADKTERRHLREQIAILEDSIGLIERRLT